MEKSNEGTFVCKFCNKKFPSVKSLGGHIRIHNRQRKTPKKKNNKRMSDQRDIVPLKQQKHQLCCRECGKGFVSLKALSAHMDCHYDGEKKKKVMDRHSDAETDLALTRKRSERVMEQSISESFSDESLSDVSEIDQEHKEMAQTLLMISRDWKRQNLVVNSPPAESSVNNSAILETKSSSREQLKTFDVKNQVLEMDKVAVDGQAKYAAAADDDNGDIACDSDSSGSDYFMNGPKKSDSDISVDGSLKNNGFGSGFNSYLKRFRNSDELGSKYELSKSKRVLPSNETDSCVETNSKSSMVKKAGGENEQSKVHECPICFKMFKSGQGLGSHKKTHSIGNQEHRIEKHQVAETHRNKIDLNLPATDTGE